MERDTWKSSFASHRLARGFSVAGKLMTVLLIAVTSGVLAEAKPLRLASDVWPPFTDVADKPRFAVDLVHTALERSGVEASTAISEWGEITPALREGKLDGSAAIWRSPEREAYLLYSEPYLENRLVLAGRKGSDVSARSLAELAGKRVALVEGYAYGDAVNAAVGVEIVAGRSDQDNLEKLLRGDADYMLVDDLVIQHVMTHQREEAEAALAVGSSAIARRPLHFAVRKDLPKAESIIKSFNEQIRRMQGDGSYNRNLRLTWIRADVDGDGLLEFVLQGERAGMTPPIAAYSVTVVGKPIDQEPSVSRYYVDGKVYKQWDDLPPRYKVPGGPTDSLGQSVRLLSFKF